MTDNKNARTVVIFNEVREGSMLRDDLNKLFEGGKVKLVTDIYDLVGAYEEEDSLENLLFVIGDYSNLSGIEVLRESYKEMPSSENVTHKDIIIASQKYIADELKKKRKPTYCVYTDGYLPSAMPEHSSKSYCQQEGIDYFNANDDDAKERLKKYVDKFLNEEKEIDGADGK